MTKKISIIIPIYNTAKYLSTCLDSIINQTYKNLEIILIDDGSTDPSGKIADDYAKKDLRIKVVHQKNAGGSAARNQGLKIATGDFISFVDSDDKVKPTFLENLLSAMSEDVYLAVCGLQYNRLKQKSTSDVFINPLPKFKRESNKAYVVRLLTLDGRLYACNNKLYRAKIAKNCAFDESLNFAEDTKFVLDYLKKSTGEIAFVLKPLYVYNFGTETSTIRSSGVIWKNWETSYKNLKNWLGKNPTLTEKFWLKLVHLRWRISYLRSKRRAKQ